MDGREEGWRVDDDESFLITHKGLSFRMVIKKMSSSCSGEVNSETWTVIMVCEVIPAK